MIEIIKRIRPRTRRCVIVLAGIAAVAVVGWKIAEYVISVDRYRPALIASLQEATGLSAAVGELDLTVFPSPRVVATDIVLGEGDFRMSIPQVSVAVWPWSLLRRRLDLSTITLYGPVIQIPADPKQVTARFEKMASAKGNVQKTAGVEVDVARIRVSRGQVRIGDAELPSARFDLEATDILSESVPISMDMGFPALGDEAHIQCDIVVGPHAGPSLRGTARMEGVQLNRLADWAPEAQVTAQGQIDGSSLKRLSLALTGDVVSQSVPALNGSVTATAWWDNGAVTVNDVLWQSPAGTVSGDITRTPERDYAASVKSVQLGPAAAGLLALWSRDPAFRIAANPDASIQVSDLTLGVTNNHELRLGKGDITFGGMSLISGDNVTLAENLHGQADIEGGLIRVKELKAKGLALAGTVAPDLAHKSIHIELAGTGDLQQPIIAELIPKERMGEMSGTLSLQRVSGTFVPGQGFPADFVAAGAVEQGRFAFTSIYLAKPLAFENVRGGFEWKEGALNLKEMAADGVVVSGVIAPNLKTHETAFDLAGQVELEKAPLAAVLPPNVISNAQGKLAVRRVVGTFRRGESIPSDLSIEGTLSEGAFSMMLPSFADNFSAVTANVTAKADTIDVDATANSALLGLAQCAGRYTLSTATWAGTATCDMQRMGELFPVGAEQKTILSSLLASYGPSTLQTNVVFPSATSTDISLKVARSNDPKLNVTVSFSKKQAGWSPESALVTADVATESLHPILPQTVTPKGVAGVELRLVPESQTFTLRGDLAQCELGLGPYLRKQAGDPLVVSVSGRRSETGWQPETGSLVYNNLEIPMRFETGRVFCDAVDVDLASVSGLFTSGSTAHGKVRGAIATNPLSTKLQVENAGFALAPDLAIESINGDLTCDNGRWACRDLALKGAGSDFHVAGESQDRNWRGQITGACVDLNGIQALVRGLNPSEDGAADSATRPPFHAEMAMNVDALLFRRARIERATADLVIDNDGIRTQNFQGTPTTGTVSGQIEITNGQKPAPGRFKAALTLDQAGANVVDEILFEQPRQFSGTVNGNVILDLPRAKGRDVANGANGQIEFKAAHGSFGQLGFTTKILTVLRTTEVLRLRLPTLKDEGLVYDACAGKITIKEGILALEAFQLQSPSYAMAAKGVIDFPKDASDIRVRVQPLEVVSGVIQHVPVIGEAASMVTSVHLRVEGSPYEPSVSLDHIERAGEATKKVEDTAVSIIQGTIGNLLKR